MVVWVSLIFFWFFLGLGGGGNFGAGAGTFGIARDEVLDVARKAPMLLFAAFQGIAEKLARHRNRPFLRFFSRRVLHTCDAESMNNGEWGQDPIFTFCCFFSYSV